MQIIFNATSLLALGAKLQARGAEAPGIMEAHFAALGPAVEAIAVPAIRDVTPSRTGRLAESTVGHTVIGGLHLHTDIAQPAVSEPNMDGSGGGEHYVQWVVGGRPAIDAPSSGPFTTGKKALAGAGFGPVKHVGPAVANPYPDEARPLIETALSAMLMTWGQTVARELIAL